MKCQPFLASLMLASGSLLVQPVLADDAHHPEKAAAQAPAPAQSTTPAAQDRMQMMRSRMMEIRSTKDATKRMQMMEAQMKDMEAMLQDPKLGCPMAGGQGGMMGSGMGMMGGQGGMGMMGQRASGQQGMSGQDDMMMKRMDMMEKRMDMMQIMMQKSMGAPQAK